MQARQGRGPLRHARQFWRWLLSIRVPVIKPLAAFLYAEREVRGRLFPLFLKILYREPLLRYRCASVGERLDLEGAIPLITGNGRIEIGDDVSIGGRNSWAIGFKVSQDAELRIGNRVHIGYQNTISVARSIRIGDDTMIAPNVQIYDNISHPLSPLRRLRHDSFTLDEATPVEIGKNVWIGSHAIILPGSSIGENSVVGAGSVVTRPVPANSFVAGNPARIIRSIAEDERGFPPTNDRTS